MKGKTRRTKFLKNWIKALMIQKLSVESSGLWSVTGKVENTKKNPRAKKKCSEDFDFKTRI